MPKHRATKLKKKITIRVQPFAIYRWVSAIEKKNSRSMADKLETIRHNPSDFNKFFENKEEKNTIP